MRKLNFAFLLAMLTFMGGGKSLAHDIEVANADGVTIYYNYTNNQTELEVTYKGDSNPTIFSNHYSGKVVIPESVTTDGQTYSVTTIGDYAFYSCRSLTEVTIPNSVTSIGEMAFYRCSGLTELTIPGSVTSIGYSAFRNCSGLTEVTIPNSVTSIGNYAFEYCSGLTELTIGNSVTSIGNNAFAFCSGLKELTIPSSVTSIGSSAFDGCSGLEKITVESGNPIFDSRENCNAIIKTNTNELITGCKNTIIPNSVTSIGNSAFYYCSGLTELTIPGSVTSIGNYAFRNCSSLTKVTIPNSVTSIGNSAFDGCSGLTEVTIPGSVMSISSSAFENCSGLEKITVEDGNPNYDSRENCNAIIETNSNKLIAGCKNTIIPNSVTSIGKEAFYGCSGLTELTIPGSVTSIGNFAFMDCSGLTEVTIPNSVTSIGDGAFRVCSGLTEVTIGNSVTSIGDLAFRECSKLTTIYSLNTTPPSVDNTNAFDGLYATADLFVPEEALAAYQAANVWKEFQKLQGFDATAVAKVSAAEQIQTANGQITVTGLTDGTTVTVYDLSGKQVGTATSKGGQVNISTGMTAGAAAIVKVGERSVKTVMK